MQYDIILFLLKQKLEVCASMCTPMYACEKQWMFAYLGKSYASTVYGVSFSDEIYYCKSLNYY